MGCPRPYIVGGLLMAAAASITVMFASCTAPAAADDPPYPAPIDRRNAVYGTHIDLDGQRYRCVVRSSQGIDCDWDHPIGTPTPDPAPSRTR